MKPLHLDWVKDVENQAKKDDFEAYLRNNTRLFSKLEEIVNEWEDALDRQERSMKQYETANWQLAQAHRNGNVEMINKLRDLISFYK